MKLKSKIIALICFYFFALNFSVAQNAKLILPFGHTDEISKFSFTPSKEKVFTISKDQTVKLWDATSGKLLHSVTRRFGKDEELHSATLPSGNGINKEYENINDEMIFSKSENYGIILTYGGDLTILDFNEERVLLRKEGKKSYYDGNYSLLDGNKKFSIFKTVNHGIWVLKIMNSLTNKSIDSIIINIKFKTQLEVLQNKIQSSKIPITWRVGDIQDVSFGGAKNLILIYDSVFELNSNKFLFSVKSENTSYNSDYRGKGFSSDGKKLLILNNKYMKIWDVEKGEMEHVTKLEESSKKVKNTAISSDGKLLYVDADKKTIWELSDGHKKNVDTKNNGEAYFSKDGSIIMLKDYFNPENDIKKVLQENGGNSYVKLFNSNTGALIDSIHGGFGYSKRLNDSISIFFSIDTVNKKNLAEIWNVYQKHNLSTIVLDSSICLESLLSPNDSITLLVIKKNAEEFYINLYHTNTGKQIRKSIKLDNYYNDVFSIDNNKFMYTVRGSDVPVQFWDIKSSEPISKKNIWNLHEAVLMQNGKKLLTFSQNDGENNIQIWDLPNFSSPKTYSLDINEYVRVDDTYFTNNKFITISRTNDTIKIWDIDKSKPILSIELAPNAIVSDVNYAANWFTAIRNNEVLLYDLKTGEHKLSFYSTDSLNWIVMHPSGLFDASPGAMDKMYWVKGNDFINLNQLKDRYWSPGLWKTVMNNEPLRDVEGMNQVKLYPNVTLSEVKDGKLTIMLQKREGGYGKVSILVNDKERVPDARPDNFDTSKLNQTITIDLKKWMVERADFHNKIEVKVRTADGFITSSGNMVDYVAVKVLNMSTSDKASARGVPDEIIINKKSEKPAFYAVIIGTGEFSNKALNLKFPAKDAQAISKAINLAASNLFGKDSTHIYEFYSPGGKASNKLNIQQSFEEIRAKAKPADIVFVYLSGHGMTYGGEKGDFYYLTTDYSGTIGAESLGDPQLRLKESISTEEFTEWLNKIPALKNVMILDACGSGKAIENLLAKKDVEASQIKAIDRMKDRTGLFIISGCTANAVSYESSKYGQGILTYSILQGIKGAALRENKYVDIINILNYSKDEVPKMAAGFGGVQQPQLLVPSNGSFDIGIINDTDKIKIPLASTKTVFIRTVVVEKSSFQDKLNLSEAIDEKLNEIASKENPSPNILFLDVRTYPDALSITGGYQVKDDLISFDGTLNQGVNSTPITIQNATKEQLVDKILAKAFQVN
jgi:WD40 repeat protein